jgi:predicted N-acyltransferase
VQAKSATSTSRIWQPVTATLTAPEGAVSVMVVLYSDSTSMGKAFFDYAGLQIEY